MWLNIIKNRNNKPLSQIEVLMLSMVPEHAVKPSFIINNLGHHFSSWSPESGTIYPVLHRLSRMGLLATTRENGLTFRRTDIGSAFATSMLDELTTQIDETATFFELILKNIAEMDPIPIGKMLPKVVNRFEESIEVINSLKRSVDEDSSNWVEIPLE